MTDNAANPSTRVAFALLAREAFRVFGPDWELPAAHALGIKPKSIRNWLNAGLVPEGVVDALRQMEGAYSLVVLNDTAIGVRNPAGLRDQAAI